MRNGAGPTIVRSSSTRGFAIQEDISQPARTVRVPEVPKMLEAGQPSPRLVPGPDFDLGVVSCEIRRSFCAGSRESLARWPSWH